MTKRKLRKLVKRAVHLPRGLDFFKYVANKLKAYYLKKTKSLKVAYPSTIMIEVTNLCNLKCVTCPREYIYGQQMDKGFIDFEKFKKIVDVAYPYIDSIGLTGLGETFLYKDIVKAVEYIKGKSKGIIVSCSINAHLKNSVEIAEKIAGKIDTIQISMDGLHDVYDKIRIKGDFNFFEKNLKEIVAVTKNTDTDIMLNIVLVKENYHQMPEIIEYAHNLGIKFVNMIPINLVANTDTDISYYEFFFTPEYLGKLKEAKNVASKFQDMEFTYSELTRDNGFNTCKYPWNYFYISWDGLLPPCCAKPFPKELTLGNLFEDGLLKSLNSEEFQNWRKLWYKNITPEFCKKCLVTT